MSEWNEYKLSDILTTVKKQYQPIKGDNLAYIGLEHIQQKSLRLEGVGNSDNVTSQKFMFTYGDVLFGKLRPYFRKVVSVNFEGVCSTDIWVLKAKSGHSQKFIKYLVASTEFIETCNIGESGTRMPRADWNYLKDTLWLLPDYTGQERIAEVLSSLDDKIDLLHRQNKTLEQMAETLFRQWFVEEAEWNHANCSIYEYVTVDYGYPFNSKLFNENKEGIPLIRIRDIKDGSMNTFTTEEADKKYLVKKGDLLVGMDGEFRIHMWKGDNAWLNQRVCRINPKPGIPDFFVFFLMKPHLDFYEQTKGGTTVIHLGKSDLDEIKVSLYQTGKIEKFKKVSEPLFQKSKNNSTTINNLETLRDTLLPKLMSGAVRVN
jgi:type I restriction enzyme S subunit